MNMIIHTPYGDEYKVDLETGNIAHLNQSFSGQWKFVAFSHVKMRRFIKLSDIRENPSILQTTEFTWKNGKPQWTVRDLDYGTLREWGNTKVHGVKYAVLES